MVSRIGLVVVLAFAALPATLMGSNTYYFINQNPNYSDSLVEASEVPVWQAEMLEIESDLAVSAPAGYVATDTAEIHSLGLLTPSEIAGKPGTYKDWYTEFWRNRQWGSCITTSYATQGYKRVSVMSGTYRYTVPGTVAVQCSTYRNSLGYWGPGWKVDYWWKVERAKAWLYKSDQVWSWKQKGWHWWGSGDTEHSQVVVEW